MYVIVVCCLAWSCSPWMELQVVFSKSFEWPQSNSAVCCLSLRLPSSALFCLLLLLLSWRPGRRNLAEAPWQWCTNEESMRCFAMFDKSPTKRGGLTRRSALAIFRYFQSTYLLNVKLDKNFRHSRLLWFESDLVKWSYHLGIRSWKFRHHETYFILYLKV